MVGTLNGQCSAKWVCAKVCCTCCFSDWLGRCCLEGPSADSLRSLPLNYLSCLYHSAFIYSYVYTCIRRMKEAFQMEITSGHCMAQKIRMSTAKCCSYITVPCPDVILLLQWSATRKDEVCGFLFCLWQVFFPTRMKC